MFRSTRLRAVLIMSLGLLLSGCGSDWFGPEDYSECVLRGIGNQTDVDAAAEVRRRCRELFPGRVKQQRSRDLPEHAIAKLRYDAELFFNKYLNGTVYNDNDDYVVTEVLIAVEVVENGDKKAFVYNEQVLIDPNSSGDFGLEVSTSDKIVGWHIASARGIEAE